MDGFGEHGIEVTRDWDREIVWDLIVINPLATLSGYVLYKKSGSNNFLCNFGSFIMVILFLAI